MLQPLSLLDISLVSPWWGAASPGSQGDKDSDEGGAWSPGLNALSAGHSFPGPVQRAGLLPFCSPNRKRGCWLRKPACTTKLLDV